MEGYPATHSLRRKGRSVTSVPAVPEDRIEASSRCSVAHAERTKMAWDVRAVVEVGVSKRRGAKRDERACGVRPERWE